MILKQKYIFEGWDYVIKKLKNIQYFVQNIYMFN